MGNDGFTLIGKLFHESAHAQFVGGVRRIERRELGIDQRLELAGPGYGFVDSVCQRVNLSTNSLANAFDRRRRFGFGIDEAIRDFCHGARDQSHFLRAAH